MIKKSVVVLAFIVASCVAPGGSGETYQRILSLLCSAPPNIMAGVLTTPELQKAWSFICTHVASVPPVPVTQ